MPKDSIDRGEQLHSMVFFQHSHHAKVHYIAIDIVTMGSDG